MQVQQWEFRGYSDCLDEIKCKCSNVFFIIIVITRLLTLDEVKREEQESVVVCSDEFK